jgi:uncharacterized peroxidase-related enzyme
MSSPDTIQPTKSLLPLIEESEATGEVAEAYARYHELFGRSSVPGILRCFATHPPLLQHMLGLAPSLLFCDGHLTRRQKEMIATFVSAHNDCPYCLDSHGSFLRDCGGSDNLIAELTRGNTSHSSLSQNERTLLDFASKVTVASHSINERDIQIMRDAGWDTNAIAETVHIGSLFAFFNRVANAFGLSSQHRLDFDPLDPLQPQTQSQETP